MRCFRGSLWESTSSSPRSATTATLCSIKSRKFTASKAMRKRSIKTTRITTLISGWKRTKCRPRSWHTLRNNCASSSRKPTFLMLRRKLWLNNRYNLLYKKAWTSQRCFPTSSLLNSRKSSEPKENRVLYKKKWKIFQRSSTNTTLTKGRVTPRNLGQPEWLFCLMGPLMNSLMSSSQILSWLLTWTCTKTKNRGWWRPPSCSNRQKSQ